MLDSYQTVYEGGEGEIEEKKSRFIAHVRPVESEEEALAFIAEIKKKYWDARHNCYAWRIGERSENSRASDDGEPSGTAGRPMLDVLAGGDLHNVCVVVTRYFGGTLLGTGGLVRAYSAAVQAGLENSVVIEKIRGYEMILRCDYGSIGKLQYLFGQMDLTVLSQEYTDRVEFHVLVPFDGEKAFEKKITESFSGTLVPEKARELYFAKAPGGPLLFDH